MTTPNHRYPIQNILRSVFVHTTEKILGSSPTTKNCSRFKSNVKKFHIFACNFHRFRASDYNSLLIFSLDFGVLFCFCLLTFHAKKQLIAKSDSIETFTSLKFLLALAAKGSFSSKASDIIHVLAKGFFLLYRNGLNFQHLQRLDVRWKIENLIAQL